MKFIEVAGKKIRLASRFARLFAFLIAEETSLDKELAELKAKVQ